MYVIKQSSAYQEWFRDLRDLQARRRIDIRLGQVALGNLGDRKSVGDGVSELRLNYGPGYRIYYTVRRRTVVLLLVGGDKGSQTSDINRAKRIALEWTDADDDGR